MAEEQSSVELDEFFIPNLCNSKAVFWLVLVAELFVLILVLALPSSHGFDWGYLALVSFLVQWVVLISAALVCRLRPWLGRQPLPQAVGWVLGLVLLVTLLCSMAGLWMLSPWNPQFWAELNSWHLLRNLLISGLVSGMLLRYFFLLQQLKLRQRAAVEARRDALQARMEPHFLFNTLNSLIGLVHAQPERAEEALLDLSDLLRASLDDKRSLIPLADELRLCRGYLRIEQLRLGKRLRVQWELKLAESVLVPPFCLQPLLENAIVHGIAQSPEGGLLRIRGGQQLDEFWIEVSNPLPPRQRSSAGNRMAVANIQARLQTLFGERARLQLRTEEGRYSAQLRWPGVQLGE